MIEPTSDEARALVSEEAFNKNYNKVLLELDALHRGVFDESEADSIAALCLLTQVGLLKAHASAEALARGLKRDIDFAKADAYYNLRQKPVDGKKLAEAALAQLVLRDDEVNRLYKEQNVAEKEAREFTNLLNVFRDAHITFRTIKRGV